MQQFKSAVFYGGIPIKEHIDWLKYDCPHCVVGTLGRILALIRDGDLNLDNVKHFVLDECDRMLEELGVCVMKGHGSPLTKDVCGYEVL